MRNLLIISALTVLGACGYSEESFSEDFTAAYCDAWATCNTSGEGCPLEAVATGTTTSTDSGCDTFDSAAAKDCVNGEFTCDTSFGEGLEMVMPPEACNNVCPAGTTETTGTTGTTTATTTAS